MGASATHAHTAVAAVNDDAFKDIARGRIAIWWFLASEIMVFGGFITCYVLFRYAHGGWEDAARHVNWRLGALNTLVLLTSSLTMILAHYSIKIGDKQGVKTFLSLTIALGLTFLVVKGFEYHAEFAEGFTPLSGMFWSFYFLMTGLHGLHLLAGIIINLSLLIMAVRGTIWAHADRVEFGGLYWHFVDVVWIFLFPLLYLT
jgi:heme/copper-type cytochrome/quinol oxidase subunit 3